MEPLPLPTARTPNGDWFEVEVDVDVDAPGEEEELLGGASGEKASAVISPGVQSTNRQRWTDSVVLSFVSIASREFTTLFTA